MMAGVLPEIEWDNEAFEVRIDFNALAIGKDDVARSLGYPEGKIPEHFEILIGRVLAQLPRKCAIRAGYRILDTEKPGDRNDGMFVGGTFFTMQKVVAGRMKNAEQAACFVCTIGPNMEAWAGQLVREGDPVMGHVADTVATVAVESTVGVLHDHLGMKMGERGLRITNRYSPGYCGWPVSEQHELFSFFPAHFCGVTLTESALMKPIKSVSGMIGIGKAVNYAGYTCVRCRMRDCTYRAFRAARKRKTLDRQEKLL